MDFFYVFEDCKTKEISKIIIDYNSNQKKIIKKDTKKGFYERFLIEYPKDKRR